MDLSGRPKPGRRPSGPGGRGPLDWTTWRKHRFWGPAEGFDESASTPVEIGPHQAPHGETGCPLTADAERYGYVTRNAARPAKPIAHQHREVEPLKLDEARALLEQVSGHPPQVAAHGGDVAPGSARASAWGCRERTSTSRPHG